MTDAGACTLTGECKKVEQECREAVRVPLRIHGKVA